MPHILVKSRLGLRPLDAASPGIKFETLNIIACKSDFKTRSHKAVQIQSCGITAIYD